MRVLHVAVEQGEEYLVAQGLEEPGVITQGRTFDELIANVRNAAEVLLEDKELHIELLVPSQVKPKGNARSRKLATSRR